MRKHVFRAKPSRFCPKQDTGGPKRGCGRVGLQVSRATVDKRLRLGAESTRPTCAPGEISETPLPRIALGQPSAVVWVCCWKGRRSIRYRSTIWRTSDFGARFYAARSRCPSRRRSGNCWPRWVRSCASSSCTDRIRKRRSRRCKKSGGIWLTCRACASRPGANWRFGGTQFHSRRILFIAQVDARDGQPAYRSSLARI